MRPWRRAATPPKRGGRSAPRCGMREESRDIRLVTWLDSLRADAVFGWRQLMKKKVTSAAAILSLALAIGACTWAFRLIDALLLRPLPVAASRAAVRARPSKESTSTANFERSTRGPIRCSARCAPR